MYDPSSPPDMIGVYGLDALHAHDVQVEGGPPLKLCGKLKELEGVRDPLDGDVDVGSIGKMFTVDEGPPLVDPYRSQFPGKALYDRLRIRTGTGQQPRTDAIPFPNPAVHE
jgi:hypothetical protein